MAFFAQDDKNNQDPNQSGGVQAPVFTGTTTREQAAMPTGGSTAASSAAPATAAAGGTPGAQAPVSAKPTASAPKWTNLVDFLGSQSGSEQASVANKVTQGAEQATQQAKQQMPPAGGVNSDIASGGHTGSVLQTSAGGVNAAPSYDLSKVNLAGYTGPSATDVASRYTAAQQAGVNAAQQASALASGTPSKNAYENALLTTTPNWSKVLDTVTGANQAAQQATAGSAGAQEQVAAAQRAANANVAQQKSDLTNAAQSINNYAKNAQTYLQGYKQMLSGADPTGALSQLAYDPQALSAFGMTQSQALALRDGVRSGKLSASNVVNDYLAPYAAAAGNATGLTTQSAGQLNQINTLLGNGAPQVSANPTGTYTGPSVAQREQQNTNDLAQVRAWASKLAENANGSTMQSGIGTRKDTAAAIKELITNGYTPDQIAKMTGLSIDMVNNTMKYGDPLLNGSQQGSSSIWDTLFG